MLSFILGYTTTYLLTSNRDALRKGAVHLIVEVTRSAKKLQAEAQTFAAALAEDLQDIMAEARAQHEAKKAVTSRPAAEEAN